VFLAKAKTLTTKSMKEKPFLLLTLCFFLSFVVENVLFVLKKRFLSHPNSGGGFYLI